MTDTTDETRPPAETPVAQSECQWPECHLVIKNNRFLCSRHWYALPLINRQTVDATWRQRLASLGTPRYPAARAAHEHAKEEALTALAQVVRPKGAVGSARVAPAPDAPTPVLMRQAGLPVVERVEVGTAEEVQAPDVAEGTEW